MSSRAQAIKRAQGYEQHPPRCSNCAHFVPPVLGIPGARRFRPPLCGVGEFAVNPVGICELWAGQDGSTLEKIA